MRHGTCPHKRVQTDRKACTLAVFAMFKHGLIYIPQGAHLWVDIRVDAEHEASALVVLPCRGLDVLKVKLRVNVDEDALLDSQLQLPGQLAIAVEDGPVGRMKFRIMRVEGLFLVF
jgi:hypothetical protein